jgi:hypothetical protein
MKSLILISVLLASSYGSAAILLARTLPLPLFHPWFAWAVWNAAPLALLVSAIWAGFRMRQYRHMAGMRESRAFDPGALLARGESLPMETPAGVSGPERLCQALILLALVTIPVWLELPSPLLWIGTGLVFWLLIRWLLHASCQRART